jgi:hypothetical protein
VYNRHQTIYLKDNMNSFDTDYPIFIGFSGPAGVGKTLTAKSLAGANTTYTYGDRNHLPDTLWHHFWFALPLYDMVDIKTRTKGVDQESRILYGLHDIVNDVMMKRMPYEDMVELVYDLYTMPCRTDGKPREFLQNAGTLCRSFDPDCFAEYIRRRVISAWHADVYDYDIGDQAYPKHYNIISDVRMPNEAAMIHDQHNHLMIKFVASPEECARRLEERDGVSLTPKQAAHETENNYDAIPEDWFDFVIDTTGMSVEEQSKIVYNWITQ